MGDRQAKDALYDALGFGRARRSATVAAPSWSTCSPRASGASRSSRGRSGSRSPTPASTCSCSCARGSSGTRRDGARVRYSLADEAVGDLWRAVRDVAARHVGPARRPGRGVPRRPLAAALDRPGGAAQAPARRRRRRSRRPPARRVRRRAPARRRQRAARGAPGAPRRPHGRQTVVAYCRGPLCAYADEGRAHADGAGADLPCGWSTGCRSGPAPGCPWSVRRPEHLPRSRPAPARSSTPPRCAAEACGCFMASQLLGEPAWRPGTRHRRCAAGRGRATASTQLSGLPAGLFTLGSAGAALLRRTAQPALGPPPRAGRRLPGVSETGVGSP